MNSNFCIPCIKEKAAKHAVVIIVYLVLCIGVAAFWGYRTSKSAGQESEGYKEKLAEYTEALSGYESAIQDTEVAITEQDEAIASLEEYINNSVYMKLDPDRVNVGSIQYMLTVAEGVNIGSVGNALVSYARDGGLVSDAQEMSESPDIKYWQEVITLQLNANTNFNVNIMTYSPEKAQEAVDIIKKCIDNYVPVINENFGEFKLEIMNESVLEKVEASIVNGQNNHRNNLRSYLNIRADLENKIVNLHANIESFNEKYQPVSDAVSPKKAFIKGFMIVMILGVGALIGLFWLFLTFDRIVRGAADIENAGAILLGTYKGKKGFDPEAKRIAMDAELVSGSQGRKGVYLANIGDEKETEEAIGLLTEELTKKGISTDKGMDPVYKADCLEKMVAAGQCILFVRCGLTKTDKIVEFYKVCKKYGINVIGTIAVVKA